MKKIIIGILLFFNFGIKISNHQIMIHAGSTVYAQHEGEITCPPSSGNGTESSWWDTFTDWVDQVIDAVVSWLGELFTGDIEGDDTFDTSSLSYLYSLWSVGDLPSLEVYYDGEGYAGFMSPSIYGGPYSGGQMWNSTDGTGTMKYVDCAGIEHDADGSGINARSEDIAYLDECSECVGGSTGLPPCSSPLYYLKFDNGDNTKYYEGDTVKVDPSPNWYDFAHITLYNEHGVTPGNLCWFPTSNSSTPFNWPWDVGNTEYLDVHTPGDYTIIIDTGTILAHGTFFTTPLHVGRRDTVKPTPDTCSPLAVTRDSITTSIYSQIASSPELIRTRDSALGNHEVSFSTYDSSGSTRVYPGIFHIGDTTSVPLYLKDTVTGANHRNINSVWHLHEAGVNHFPDPADLFNLLWVRTLYYNPAFLYYNPHLNHSFIVGDTSTDIAIVVYDTVQALQFINLNPRDSVIRSGVPLYSLTYKGQPVSGLPSVNVAMGKDFRNAVVKLGRMHYPQEWLATYAGAYMMQRYNMGIKTLIKVNGVFKELKINATYYRNGEIRTLVLKICQ